MKYLYKVAYTGWNFSGSQIQPDRRTVEGELENAVGKRCKLMSRTDAGVSARGNVLVLDEKISVGKVNAELKDVVIWAEASALRVPKVKHRHYRYFLVGYSEAEAKSLLKFNGTKDFREFTRTKEDTIRTVKVRAGRGFVDFFSRGFLWNQVRRMVGSARKETAPPEPLVLVDIAFRKEPDWKLHTTWFRKWKKQSRKIMETALALGEISRT